MKLKTEWVLCPVCGSKTRNRVREDTEMKNYPLFCPNVGCPNVFSIMQIFNKLYAITSDEEKNSLVSYLIKEVPIYSNGESDRILKSIEFNFPIYRDGREIRKLLWKPVIPSNVW